MKHIVTLDTRNMVQSAKDGGSAAASQTRAASTRTEHQQNRRNTKRPGADGVPVFFDRKTTK